MDLSEGSCSTAHSPMPVTTRPMPKNSAGYPSQPDRTKMAAPTPMLARAMAERSRPSSTGAASRLKYCRERDWFRGSKK